MPRTRTTLLALALASAALAQPSGTDMHTPTDTKHDPNGLANETSPYLLQHANNPVRWLPWGPEAFNLARERNVPIFLSIGYSTCYWCHVMERESFENEDIAAIMNEHFVCVKVDREERPDIDEIYMAATQMISGGGGWPMSVWLTPPGATGADDPGLKPFFAGTYYPPEPRYGRIAFPDLLNNIADIWTRTPEQITDQAEDIAKAVRARFTEEQTEPVRVDDTQIRLALSQLVQIYDREHAGFGTAPKFPQAVYAEFLFEIRDTIADPAIRTVVANAAKQTLDRMATGGIYDQVGGGFHRYSTDRQWLVPHFEKMLYDNGQLASLYALSAALTNDAYHLRVCADILEYVKREMTDENGAFYSAQDAEVEAREGLNYLWTEAQIRDALDEDDAAFAIKAFGLDQGTNFTDPHFPDDGPRNVLFFPARPKQLAEKLGMTLEEFIPKLDNVRATLLAVRDEREQPGLDDKIITSWNGLMIKAFADGALVLRSIDHLRAGEKASDYIYERMRDSDGNLRRTSRNGQLGPHAFLEDYACYIQGLLAMHRASSAFGQANPEHLTRARALTRAALENFSDDDTGALYDTLEGQADLFVRTRSTYDGAMPCGQSVMLHNLVDLFDITHDHAYFNRAVALLGSMSRDISESPLATINSVRAMQRMLRINSEFPEQFGPPLDTARPAEDVESPVKILTTGERLTVPASGTATLPVRIEIDEPFHINAHDPGVRGLQGLDIALAGGTGFELAIDYPTGEPYSGSAIPEELGTLLVHTGAVEFDITLTRTGEPIQGRPIITVKYQVCSDSACYQPLTVELDVALDTE